MPSWPGRKPSLRPIRQARDGTLRVIEEKDPAQAAKMLQELGRDSEILSTVQNWAKTDLDGTVQWVIESGD